jgi:hypothetical protein
LREIRRGALVKRILVALLLGSVVFGVVYGAAAALNVEGGTIQAGGDTSLACDTDGVTLAWKTMVAGDGAFHVAGVDVTNVAPQCDGQKVLVALMKSPTVIVGFARGTIASGTAQAYEFFSGGHWVNGEGGVGPAVADVESAQVLIKNAWVDYDGPSL